MKNYQDLQKLYTLAEIQTQCVDIDFAYAFICAMASSELDLQQWMPMLFISDNHHFSDEKIASEFGQTILVIYQQAMQCYQDEKSLPLQLEQSASSTGQSWVNFANGYLQALMLIDNLQLTQFQENSAIAQLQQTCLLLLDKLATIETDDLQKQALFEQLPSNNEIITLLPTLLTSYGHQCLSEQSNG